MSRSSSPTPQILVNHEGVVVVDKPPGLSSTGRDLDDPNCVQGWLMQQLRRRKVWAVHQLDRDTSGLNLFVTKKPLVPVFSEKLKLGSKTYLAVVRGSGLDGERLVTEPIGRKRVGRRWLPCLGGQQQKVAKSTVRTVSSTSEHALLEVGIATGRSHQVRLHLLHLGRPILGEQQHVSPPDTSVPRQMLHAWTLDLPDVARELVGLRVDPPADFRRVMAARGLILRDR